MERFFDITLEGRRYLESMAHGAPGKADENGGSVGYPGAYDQAYEPASGLPNAHSNEVTFFGTTNPQKHQVSTNSNLDVISNSVQISCETLLLSIEEFNEKIRGSNSLPVENPEAYSEVTNFLADLKDQIDQLIKLLPDQGGATSSNVENISNWYRSTGIKLDHNMKRFFTPEYIGENAAPLILVGLFGSLSAAIAGALGLPPTTGAVVGGIAASEYVGKGKSLVKEMSD